MVLKVSRFLPSFDPSPESVWTRIGELALGEVSDPATQGFLVTGLEVENLANQVCHFVEESIDELALILAAVDPDRELFMACFVELSGGQST